MFQKKALVLAALMALAAVAQAQVKVYGSLEMSVGSFKGFDLAADLGEGGVVSLDELKDVYPGGVLEALYDGLDVTALKGKSVTKVSSGNMMTSFIGFSGSENLGGGLKAEFVLETFIAGDTGANLTNYAGGFWSRGSYVALSGGFGKLALGQYENAMFTMGYTYNPFGSSMTFSPTMGAFYNNAIGLPILAYDTGWVNSVTYETPDLSGLTASVQFAPKETSASGRTSKDAIALSAAYNAGPLSVMGVFTKSGNTSAAYTGLQKNYGLGASYDFGVLKASAQYVSVKDETYSTTDPFKAKFYQIGASVPMSAAGSFMASFGQTKYDIGGDDLGKIKQFSVGYDHFLSKRTDVYVAYTNTKVEDVGSAGSFAVGIKHAF